MIKTSALLKEYRIKNGYTQKTLSDACKININTIKSWERRGFAGAEMRRIADLSKTLKISLCEIKSAMQSDRKSTRRRREPPTLCWECQRAAGKQMCEWAALGNPILGWEAKETIISNGGDNPDTYSYCVAKCPLYTPDKMQA